MEGGEFPQPKNILRRFADKLTRRKAPEQPEKAEELKKFVLQGLAFIKSSQYASAIRYFENSQEANRLGITLSDEGMTLIIERLPIKDM